ncbi:MAG: hypothetical protein ACRENT_06700 [Thermodesulfobacteriota bacterium]
MMFSKDRSCGPSDFSVLAGLPIDYTDFGACLVCTACYKEIGL